jgi:hypothetical protein
MKWDANEILASCASAYTLLALRRHFAGLQSSAFSHQPSAFSGQNPLSAISYQLGGARENALINEAEG